MFQISPSSGRLQLVDMTGTIDVIIPDLSLTWENSSIFEVRFVDDSTSYSPPSCSKLLSLVLLFSSQVYRVKLACAGFSDN